MENPEKVRDLLIVLYKLHRLPTANKPSSASRNNLDRVPTYFANVKLLNISHPFTSDQT
jgi:hypothetical protein